MDQPDKASFQLTTSADLHLPTYDNTKLVAMGTCPVWGVVRYQMHKRMPGSTRNLPLECGKAMHEAFAWVRLCTLMAQEHGGVAASGSTFYHGTRLFGDRLEHIVKEAGGPTDLIDYTKRGAIAVLDTSGYYDEPRDKRRTLVNMEEAILHYIDRWRWDHVVWQRDPSDPTSDVGIEWPFDIVVQIGEMRFRHTGRIDGIHWQHDKLVVHDNKTASRLNDAWEMSFATSSQVTAYCVAASVYTQHVVSTADILGLAIPLPKSYDYGGYVRTTAARENHHYRRWLSWLRETVQLYERYADDPYGAPMFTHSCNRYFRPCSLIPFCDADDDEQRRIVAELVHDEWSPLDDSTESVEAG